MYCWDKAKACLPDTIALFKGDLAAPVRRVPRRFRETRQGDLPTGNVAIGLSKHPLSWRIQF
jgi:hypothetical protein